MPSVMSGKSLEPPPGRSCPGAAQWALFNCDALHGQPQLQSMWGLP